MVQKARLTNLILSYLHNTDNTSCLVLLNVLNPDALKFGANFQAEMTHVKSVNSILGDICCPTNVSRVGFSLNSFRGCSEETPESQE